MNDRTSSGGRNANDGKSSRIIHVPRRFVAEEWGGTETVILEISKQQKRSGWRPEIITSMALATERESEIGGVPVRRYPHVYPFFGLSAEEKRSMDKKGGNLLSLSLFTALLREPNVRLFHAHALKRLGGEVRTAAMLRKKPLVVSLHGGVFDVPQSELGAMLEPIRNKIEWGKPFGALFGSRRVLEDADCVICVGKSELEKAKCELSHNRLVYLPNGVDTAKFRTGDARSFRETHGIPGDSFLVVNVSRIDAQKNQLLLIEAFARFSLTSPEARMVIVGPETQAAYGVKLREAIVRHCLGDRVKLLQKFRNDDPQLVNAIHAADAFVLPSVHEPFGIVILEAWSAGKAVIASAVGGLKALIRDGETGLLFDPGAEGAPDRLCQLLVELQSRPELRERLASAGRSEALRCYDWSVIAADLERIYLEAEENAQARRRGETSQKRN